MESNVRFEPNLPNIALRLNGRDAHAADIASSKDGPMRSFNDIGAQLHYLAAVLVIKDRFEDPLCIRKTDYRSQQVA